MDHDATSRDILNLDEAYALAIQLFDYGRRGLGGSPRRLEEEIATNRSDNVRVGVAEAASIVIEHSQIRFRDWTMS